MKAQTVNVLYYRHNRQDAETKQERGYIFTLSSSAKIIATKEPGGYRLSEYRSGALIGHADRLNEVEQVANSIIEMKCSDVDTFTSLIEKHIKHYGIANQ